MINFLHTYTPLPILFSLGPISVYWYGLFITAGFLAALAVSIRLAKPYGIKPESMIDLAVWLIIGGLIGARIYDMGLEWQSFLADPIIVFKIWQGGLAIHGAIIGGLVALWLYAKKHGHDFWRLTAFVAAALPLGQAIGRWGNYFNQELFGYPTDLPWGIPIEAAHRPWQYMNFEYFHPAFLYESIGNLLIFAAMIFLYRKKFADRKLVGAYLLMYSILRFGMEFMRIDYTPSILGLRFPQIISLIVILAVLGYFIADIRLKIAKKPALDK